MTSTSLFVILAVLFVHVYSDYKVTPFGLFHEECIIEVPSGTHVGSTFIDGVEHALLEHEDGTSKVLPKCTHENPRTNGVGAPPTWNGWPMHYWYGMDYAFFSNPALKSPVTYFEATWNVPNYPANRNGNNQAPWTNPPTMSWWTGLQPSGPFVDVLQPVLEFNGLINNDYDLSSWNCCPAGYTFHSSPIAVKPGQTLNGTMEIVSDNPYVYKIIGEVIGGQSTSLFANLTSPKPSYTWSEVKNEGYYITNCNQIPANAVTFKINSFETEGGTLNVNTLPWQQGYLCAGVDNCPSAALSSSCIGSSTQNQAEVSIGFRS